MPNGSPKSVFIGFGLATSGPVIAGIVIAVEAGVSGAGWRRRRRDGRRRQLRQGRRRGAELATPRAPAAMRRRSSVVLFAL